MHYRTIPHDGGIRRRRRELAAELLADIRHLDEPTFWVFYSAICSMNETANETTQPYKPGPNA
jgi:hypothetical protein